MPWIVWWPVMVTRPSVSPPVQYISGKIHSLRNNARSFDSSVVHSFNPIRRKLFLILRNVVIKETKTSFLYWLSSLFLSLKSLSFSRRNGSETCVYLPSDFPLLEQTRSHIPKIPLKHSLSQNCWDTFCVSLSPLCWCTRLGIQIYKKFFKNFTSAHYVNTNKSIFSLKSDFFSAHFSLY